MADVRASYPKIPIQLLEEKTIKLLPKILSGALDLAFVRPPEQPDRHLEFRRLFQESAVVAFPEKHPLARRKSVSLVSYVRGQEGRRG
jgi:DNA-binding transcriptional LysR family regulator